MPAPLIENGECRPAGAAETAPLGVPQVKRSRHRIGSRHRIAWVQLRRRLIRPTRGFVLFVVAVFVVDQTAYQLIGKPIAFQAPLDWTAHVATTLLIIWALVPALREGQLAPALLASVVASHLWRDLAEPAGSGVALFWPISTRTGHTPSMIYLLSIALLAGAAYGRVTQRARLSVPLVGHP